MKKRFLAKCQRFFNSKGGKRLAGGAVGLINGLFGSGGGMLAVPLFTLQGLGQKQAQATAIAVILPLSALSFLGYALFSGLPQGCLFTALGAVGGGAVGALLLGRLSNVWLHRLFCLLMLLAGGRMLF